MVTSIVRQSIIIKCNQQSSILVGNYELYYVAGLMKKLFDLDLHEEMKPMKLYEVIQTKLESIEPKDEKEGYLAKLVANYKVLEDYDDQMKELFQMGANENHLWQVNI